MVLTENQIVDVHRHFPRSSDIWNWLNGTCSILHEFTPTLINCNAVPQTFARTSTAAVHKLPFDMVVKPEIMQTSTSATFGTQVTEHD